MTSALALFSLSLSLSTDAFAASLARGACERHRRVSTALASGAIFGAAEGLMCLAGWGLGRVFAQAISALDHWIALVLLTLIGARMIREGLQPVGEDTPQSRKSLLGTVLTAIGTSVDSATVGVALALAGTGAIAALAIGTASFAASTAGYLIGPTLGSRFGKRAEIAGGLVLILIGVSIFADHTWLATG